MRNSYAFGSCLLAFSLLLTSCGVPTAQSSPTAVASPTAVVSPSATSTTHHSASASPSKTASASAKASPSPTALQSQASPSAQPTATATVDSTVKPTAQATASPTSAGTTAAASVAPATVDCRVQKCIALTFDDGPGIYTNQILDTLAAHGAKATFFTIGKNVATYPSIVKREHDLGMAIGDHTWNHVYLSKVSNATATAEISQTAEAIKNATGEYPFAVRPPYGAFTSLTPHAGYPFVLWDIDSEDWKNRNAQLTTQRIMASAHPGGIVLMHDIHPSTAQALAGIIDQLQAKGYQLVTVPEILVGVPDANSSYYYGYAPAASK